jgi:tetratricopeptide (TPR) repeat protein
LNTKFVGKRVSGLQFAFKKLSFERYLCIAGLPITHIFAVSKSFTIMRPHPLLIVSFFFITFNSGFAQDSLVRYTDLSFSTDFERRAFEQILLHQGKDYFALLIASETGADEAMAALAKTRFYSHISGFNDQKFALKKDDKKVKFVYDNLHKTFLAKYEMKNHFGDIFKNGYYNCVSASALFGLAFAELQIPFVVIERPTHVYIVAYPEGDRVVVETTIPNGGFLDFTDSYKANYVKMLKDQKLVSAQEFATIDANQLFNKYYFGNEKEINLTQLAALQYLNDGLYKIDEANYDEAMKQFEKAYILYPTDRTGYSLYLASAQAFAGRKMKDDIHALSLAKMSKFRKMGITHDMVMGEFNRAIQYWLFDQGQKEKMTSYYSVLLKNVQDDSLKTDITFLYNYENGRLLYNQARYKEALPFFEATLAAKPGNAEVGNMFISCLGQSAKHASSAEIVKSFEQYSVKYPKLLENNMFNLYTADLYLSEFDRLYREENITEGEKFRNKFEQFAAAHKDLDLNQQLIAHAYSSAALYHFRKGQNAKAKTLIDRGLAIAPDNYELKNRKKMIR